MPLVVKDTPPAFFDMLAGVGKMDDDEFAKEKRSGRMTWPIYHQVLSASFIDLTVTGKSGSVQRAFLLPLSLSRVCPLLLIR